jgi:hypothetical protein
MISLSLSFPNVFAVQIQKKNVRNTFQIKVFIQGKNILKCIPIFLFKDIYGITRSRKETWGWKFFFLDFEENDSLFICYKLENIFWWYTSFPPISLQFFFLVFSQSLIPKYYQHFSVFQILPLYLSLLLNFRQHVYVNQCDIMNVMCIWFYLLTTMIIDFS